MDRDGWGQVLDEANEHLENNNVTHVVLDPAQQLFQNIYALVPCQLTRLQIALQPLLRRQQTLVP